jgi:hypothetical protein
MSVPIYVPEDGMPDTDMPEDGIRETGLFETGISEAGMPETGRPEAGMPEAGMHEDGMPEANMSEARMHEADISEADIFSCFSWNKSQQWKDQSSPCENYCKKIRIFYQDHPTVLICKLPYIWKIIKIAGRHRYISKLTIDLFAVIPNGLTGNNT